SVLGLTAALMPPSSPGAAIRGRQWHCLEPRALPLPPGSAHSGDGPAPPGLCAGPARPLRQEVDPAMSTEIAVVIGAGSIGVAIARRAAVGRTLLLADRDREAMEAVAARLRTEGYEVATRPLDIADPTAVQALAEEAAALG